MGRQEQEIVGHCYSDDGYDIDSGRFEGKRGMVINDKCALQPSDRSPRRAEDTAVTARE